MIFLCSKAFANTTTAASGNLSDVQSAVNSANPGDTVVVPSGNYAWNGGLTITKPLVLQGAGINSTFITRSTPISYQAELVTIQPSSDVPIRVTGINFNSSSIGQNYNRLPCIAVWGPQGGSSGCTQIQIDNCYFTGGVNAVEWNYYAYGVVWGCTFLDCPYAVVDYADGDYDWSRPIGFGISNEVYIEDCSFIMDSQISYFDTLTDEDRGGRLCVRHCTVDFSQFTSRSSFGSIWMMHGNQAYWTGNPQTDNMRGAITLELYYNAVTVAGNAYRLIYLRGGQSAIYNNTFTCPSSAPLVSPTEEEGYDTRFFSTLRSTWPAEDQVNNSFFWNNTLNGQAQVASNFVDWQLPQDAIFIQQNRDYWLSAPSASTVTKYPQPASPSASNYPASVYYKPVTSYKAYTYPHPLRSGSPNAAPAPSSSPSASPPAPTHLRVAS
jgi:hypothetical protein